MLMNIGMIPSISSAGLVTVRRLGKSAGLIQLRHCGGYNDLFREFEPAPCGVGMTLYEEHLFGRLTISLLNISVGKIKRLGHLVTR